jgi:hypothetical protein
MHHKEGQIEYFGKRGMSLLGGMLVRRVTRLKGGIERLGLEYTFIDTVIDKYSSQDNLRVMAAMTLVIKLIKTKFPGIKEISIGSDNAS